MWRKEVLDLLQEKQTKHVCILLVLNSICYCILLFWCSATQSMALLAYTFTTGFNLLSLSTCILSAWVRKQKPTPLFSFGYERFEVLAVFASTVLAQLASVFIIKESIERLVLVQPQIHTGRLLLGMGLGFFSHLIVIYGARNTALEHVMAASSSSWLQEHVSDISQSICTLIPAMSSLLLPRINPLLLIASTGAMFLFLTDLLIDIRNYHMVDTFIAMLIAIMMCATMLPMSVYTGKVLLQTTPSHVIGQLDKCLRESLTIDGVLEFRNEHFWTLSFGKMAGSLQVRVRRDANEQLVLAHIIDKLSNVVPELTVQVFKDEWALRRGVNNIAPLLSMSNVLPQPLHLNNIFDPINHPINGKKVHNIPDATVLQQNENKVHVGSTNMRMKGSCNFNLQEPEMFARPQQFSAVNNAVHLNSNYNTSGIHSPPRQPEAGTVMSENLIRSNSFQQLSSDPMKFQNPNLVDTWFSKQPINLSANNSPLRKYPLLQDVPLSAHPQQLRNSNILLSGTNTLDAERFSYQPR